MMIISKLTGVYIIENTLNGKVYIGSTGVGFGRRWAHHQAMLRAGIHSNTHLQRAWDKYGEGSFIFRALEFVEDRANLLVREQYWIERYMTAGICYNIRTQAASNKGLHHSEEHKRKIGDAQRGVKEAKDTVRRMSERMKGNAHPAFRAAGIAATLRKMRPHNVSIVSPSGTIYEHIINVTVFCNDHGLNESALRRMLAGRSHGHRGWRRLDAPGTREEIIAHTAKKRMGDPAYKARCLEKTRTPEAREKARKAQLRVVYAFMAPDGTMYRGIGDLRAFCAEHGLHVQSMRCVHTDSQKVQSHKGWRKAPLEI